MRGEEQNREEGEMAQTTLGGGRNRGKSREEGEKETLTFSEEGEIGSKSREEGDLPPVPPPLISRASWQGRSGVRRMECKNKIRKINEQ